MRRSLAFACLGLLALAGGLRADTLSLSLTQHAAANVFQTLYAERDRVSALDFSLVKDLAALSLLAGAAVDYFALNPGLSFAGLRGGADYVHPLGAKSALYLAFTASGSFFRSEYSDFDHLSLEAQGTFKSYLGPSSIARAGYIFEYRDYRNGLFDFLSQGVSASLDKFFPTNTTLKAGIGWGYKYFLHPYPSFPASAGTGLEGVQNAFGGPPGKGPRGSGGYFLQPGAAGGGAGIQSVSVSALVAQGLGTRLGLALSGSRQWIVSGKTPFLASEEFFLAENPTYDSFSWDGRSLLGSFTAQGPWDTELKMIYTITGKTFPGIISMSLDGTPLGVTRKDTRRQIDIRFEKMFPRFTFFLSYLVIDNRSNDPLFSWKGPFVAAGVRWDVAFGRTE
jgi:hypothetical protein